MDKEKNRKLIAHANSFVMKLTKKDLIELLYRLGNYKLNENVYSECDGKKLPSIERNYNKETNSYEIFIRCVNNDKLAEDLYNSLTLSIPFLISGGYNPRDVLLLLTDFSISQIAFSCEDKVSKQLIYAKFMYEKFGEYYRQKYNQHIRKTKKLNTQSEK